jgi:hypothetical protein
MHSRPRSASHRGRGDAVNPDLVEGGRWPLDWRSLYPRERWLWWEQLWMDVCALRERYRLALRSCWWEDSIQVEALAALAAWTDRYDTGEWDDPPGKLALLFELERIEALLREGGEPFHPSRDREPFLAHVTELGCQRPGGREGDEGGGR